MTLQSRLDEALITELAGLPVERITDAGDPGFRITDVAHDHGVDLIMMPTHGLGLFRSLLVGSATSKVLHDARCPVWTAAHAEQQRTGGLPRTISVRRGRQSRERRAAQVGGRLQHAGRGGAQAAARGRSDHATGRRSKANERSRSRFVKRRTRTIVSLQATAGLHAPLRVAVGEIVATVTEHAREEDADLILIGRGSLQSALGRLRTHAYGIIQRSPCPVLSV